MPAQLKHGVQGAPGGRRKNAGRKPDWFKRKLRELASSQTAIKFLRDAIEGKEIDVRVSEGKVITLKPSVDTRLAAWEKTHDRGFGKPVSLLEMKDEDGKTVFPAVVLLPSKKPLDSRD